MANNAVNNPKNSIDQIAIKIFTEKCFSDKRAKIIKIGNNAKV